MRLAPVKHLLVDLDGTLLESRNLPLRADFTISVLRALRAHGLFNALRALRAVRVALEKPATALTSAHTNDRRAAAAFAHVLAISDSAGAQVLDDLVLAIFPRLEKHFYPVPGARDFLAWAGSRYPLTLATNPVWPEEQVLLRLRWAGIDPSIFTRITHARIMHACKPSAEYYRQVLEQAGLRAEDCLLIGDDLRKDLPATSVGIRTFILGPRARAEALELPKSSARAWRGSFAALRELLAPEEFPGVTK